MLIKAELLGEAVAVCIRGTTRSRATDHRKTQPGRDQNAKSQIGQSSANTFALEGKHFKLDVHMHKQQVKVPNKSGYMGKPQDATYKTGGSVKNRPMLQDTKTGKTNVSGITKLNHSTDQSMDQGHNLHLRLNSIIYAKNKTLNSQQHS